VQGKIAEADTPTVRLGATPSGLISDIPPSFLTPDAVPAATLSVYPGLRQTPSMLAIYELLVKILPSPFDSLTPISL